MRSKLTVANKYFSVVQFRIGFEIRTLEQKTKTKKKQKKAIKDMTKKKLNLQISKIC